MFTLFFTGNKKNIGEDLLHHHQPVRQQGLLLFHFFSIATSWLMVIFYMSIGYNPTLRVLFFKKNIAVY
jgi:hypothetical protein